MAELVHVYAQALLTGVSGVVVQVLPWAVAVTIFAVGAGMLVRWIGRSDATSLGSSRTHDRKGRHIRQDDDGDIY